MIDKGKMNVAGILIDAVDYETAVARVVKAAYEGLPFAVSALAVHGTMTGATDSEHRYRLNSFDLLVPDGQPVRWALNLLHRAMLPDRVYGPELTLRLLAAAAERQLPVYFYGTTAEVLDRLRTSLHERFPGIRIAGMEPSKFRRLTIDEWIDLAGRVKDSGAQILFAGLGCPRQEVFAFELRPHLSMPIVAVGAAFPFIAGTLRQAPPWMQKRGLEWLFRLTREPRRLFRRYAVTNTQYTLRVLCQALGSRFPTDGRQPQSVMLFG